MGDFIKAILFVVLFIFALPFIFFFLSLVIGLFRLLAAVVPAGFIVTVAAVIVILFCIAYLFD